MVFVCKGFCKANGAIITPGTPWIGIRAYYCSPCSTKIAFSDAEIRDGFLYCRCCGSRLRIHKRWGGRKRG